MENIGRAAPHPSAMNYGFISRQDAQAPRSKGFNKTINLWRLSVFATWREVK
jgi:hypothetical protein